MTPSTGPDKVAEAIDALAIDSLTSYVWLGQRFLVRRQAAREGARDAVVSAIAGRLYADFYCVGGPAPPEPGRDPDWGAWPSSTSLAFSRANSARSSLDPGWTRTHSRSDENDVVLQRNGLRVWVSPREIAQEGPFAAGARVDLRLTAESLGVPHGFYTAYGEAGDASIGGGPIDRFYWNVRAAGRPRLVALVTSAFNARNLPFRFKVVNDPRETRCDAAVLYTPSTLRLSVCACIEPIVRRVRAHFDGRVPVFTLPLAPGVAFAEDPGGEKSFGEHRCGLFADALVGAHQDGRADGTARAEAVLGRFVAEGLDIDALHRNAGSGAAADPDPFAT